MKPSIFAPPVEYVHVYVLDEVDERVITLPETPSPLKVPSTPQFTKNVPVADIVNFTVLLAAKAIVVTLNGAHCAVNVLFSV